MKVLAASLVIGLASPVLASLLNPLLAAAVWLLLVISLLRVDPGEAMGHLRRPGRVIIMLIWTLAVTPVLVWGLLSWVAVPLGISDGVAAGMVLAAASAPLISTPALALLMGLDGAFVMVFMIAAMALVPLTLPTVALSLLGLEMAVGAGELMARLVLLIGSAMLTAALLRRFLGGVRVRSWAPALDGSAVFMLMVFAIAIMDGLTARLMAEPSTVLYITLLSFVVYTGLIVVTVLSFAIILPGWGRKVILSAGFAAGCRNLAIILAVLPASADPDTILYFAAGQFPIYIMPAVLRPIMLRLVGKAPT